MTIAPFDPRTGDFTALAELHGACFAEAWTAKAIADLLTTPNCFAFADGNGFILARAAGGEAEILTLAVAPAARRGGLGRALVIAAAAHSQTLGAAAMFLEVGSDNPAALALYRGLAFVPVGARKGYYAGRDALVLKATLPLSPERNIA